MTKDDDPRLEGRLPEFARMSRRPGIGAGFMWDLASSLMEHNLDEKMLDVPLCLSHGTAQFPLGRFLRRKLRTYIGREPDQPLDLPPTIKEQQMQAMREIARIYQKQNPGVQFKDAFTSELLQASEGRRIQIEAKYRRQSRKGSQ